MKVYNNAKKIDTKKRKGDFIFKDLEGSLSPSFIILFILIYLLGIGLYIAFNPYNEILTCDKNLYCTVEHQYIGELGFSKKFKISPNSYIVYTTGNVCLFHSKVSLTYRREFHNENHTERHIYYNICDGENCIKPFMRFLDTIEEPNNRSVWNKSEQIKFNNYIKNPSLGYQYEAYSGIIDILYAAFLLVIVIFCPMCWIVTIYYKNYYEKNIH